MNSVTKDEERAVRGELGLGTLPALIRQLHQDRRTGTLHIREPGCERRVHFKWGAVIFADSGRARDRLDQLLLREALVDAEMLERARAAQASTSTKRYGECLIELGVLTEDELLAAVERQVRSIVTVLFSLDRGQYDFEETAEPVEQDLVLDLPMQEIILDGIRSMEDPIALQIGVGAMMAFLLPGATSENANINAAEGFVLSRADGRSNILDILAVSPLSEVETLRSICALLAVGIVEAASEPRVASFTEAPAAPPRSASTTVRPSVQTAPPRRPEPPPEPVELPKELSADDKRDLAQQSYQEARRLFSDKKYHEAIDALTEAVRLDGTQASYHRLLGYAYALNPKWTDSAIDHLERAVQLDECDVDARYLLGELYEREARGPEATREFQQVVSLDPGHAKARRKLDKPSIVTRLKSIFKKTSLR